jgi:hypothetical protein
MPVRSLCLTLISLLGVYFAIVLLSVAPSVVTGLIAFGPVNANATELALAPPILTA